MIVGVRAIPTCLDAEQHRYFCPPTAFSLHLQAYDSLFHYPVLTDQEGHGAANGKTAAPALAEGYEASRDGRTYSFSLRPHALSGAGNELTAHDVKWSWERAFALNSWGARVARTATIASPDAVRVVQNYTVRIRLEQPRPDFPLLLSGAFPPIYDLQEVRQHCPVGDPWGNEWLRTHSAGFGPYQFANSAPGEDVLLLANEHYWQGVPRTRRIVLRSLPRDRSPAALSSGTVDVAEALSSAEAEELRNCTRVWLAEFHGARELLLRMDPALPPFDQPRIRQALKRMLPYEEIARLLSASGQRVSAPADRRAAQSLLRETGYGAGFRLNLAIPEAVPDLEAVAALIQRFCIRLDLKVMVEKLPLESFADRKARRYLPLYLEERLPLAVAASPHELEPQPEVQSIVLASAPARFALRTGLKGLVRRPDGCIRYADLRKA